MKILDTFLDSITMYRTVVYGLGILVITSFCLSFARLVFYSPTHLALSLAVLLVMTCGTHYLFKVLFKAPANVESSIITALILFLIVAPGETYKEMLWIGILACIAIASKYIIAYKNKHIFNPAALALVIIGVLQLPVAIWWVGSLYMLPVVTIVGLLVVKKIRRFTLFLTYILVSTCVVIVVGMLQGETLITILIQHFVSWPTLFFGSIMLTEPFSTPPTRKLQIVYATIVGVISSIPFHVGVVYGTPELALIIGNIFSYVVSIKTRLILHFKEKITLAQDTYEFVFSKNGMLPYYAGEYMEWTLPHTNQDKRGIRRYFTIASSPTDEYVRLGVKMVPLGIQGSTFKKALSDLKEGDVVHATAVSGDFILPEDSSEKIVCIAGGIGITPFASMLRYLLARNEKRDIILFYSNKTQADIAYKDLLEEAKEKVGLKIVFLLSDKNTLEEVWQGEGREVGFLTQELLGKYIKDKESALYYLSGPHMMVETYKNLLLASSIPRKNIKTDYFPGFA